MSALFYILEANVYLAIFAVFYYFALRKEKNYLANRWVLISSVMPAYIIPALSFQGAIPDVFPTIELETITLTSERGGANPSLDYSSILLGIYSIGALITFSLFLLGLVRVFALAAKYPHTIQRKLRLIETNDENAWSFFNLIALGKNITPENRNWILAHERVHAEELHSLDKILISLVKSIGWFNPAVYYLEFALEENHEFRADEVVCNRFSDSIAYSQVLVSQSFGGINTNLLVHEFSKKSLLKSRIQMINQTKQTGKMKYLLTIPVLAVALLVHGCTKEESDRSIDSDPKKSSETSQIQTDEVLQVAEKMPEFQGGMDGLIAFMSEETVYPKTEEEGKVLVSFVVDEEGNVTQPEVIERASSESTALRAAALETVGKMPAWTPGEQSGKKVKVKMTLPIQFAME
jgi:TonB family protein